MRRRSGGFVTRPLAEWSHRLPKLILIKMRLPYIPAPGFLLLMPTVMPAHILPRTPIPGGHPPHPTVMPAQAGIHGGGGALTRPLEQFLYDAEPTSGLLRFLDRPFNGLLD